tara:strand:+ start:2351 stop:3391 length:1041 start_codon:yes stop_codon:yes gene_type:complete
MSQNPKDNRIRIAALLLIGWLLCLLVLWIGMGGEREEEWREAVFLGRFHILIVHVPIGLLCVVFFLEILGRIKPFKGWADNTMPLLWFGTLGAAAATIAGYLLMMGEQTSGNNMKWHMWTGFGVVVLGVLSLILKASNRVVPIYLLVLAGNVVLISISSHYGGNMVHTDTYLTEYAPEALKPYLGHPEEELTAADQGISVDNWYIYDDIIQPIFDAKCTECHDENKVKGDLRMDSFEWLAKGGDITDQEFIPGDAEASELYFRVTLDPDDDDFMPPGDREHMTPDEVALLGWWINEGATQEMKVGKTKKDANIERILSELVSKTEADEGEKTATTNSPSPGGTVRS